MPIEIREETRTVTVQREVENRVFTIEGYAHTVWNREAYFMDLGEDDVRSELFGAPGCELSQDEVENLYCEDLLPLREVLDRVENSRVRITIEVLD